MNCGDVKVELTDAALSRCEPETYEGVVAHLAACADCKAEFEDLAKTLRILDAAPQIKVGDRVLENLRAATRRPAETPAVRMWGRRAMMAAAAALAAVGLYFVLMPDRTPVGLVAHADDPALSGRRLRSGDTLETSAYARLDLPGIATLHLRPDTKLTIENARTVRLDSGELFACVVRGPVTVKTPTGTLRDLGTRFGVRVSTTTLVYVTDGAVQFDDLTLAAGDVAEKRGPAPAARLPRAATADALAWLSRHLPSSPRLSAAIENDTLRLTIENDTISPALIPDLTSLSQFLVLQVTPPTGQPFTIDLAAARPAITGHSIGGRYAVDAAHPLRIDLPLARTFWSERGTHLLRPTFTVSENFVDAGAWIGTIDLQSPLRLEVQD